MLILCCFLIILELKAGEGRGGRGYMVSGMGNGIRSDSSNQYYESKYRNPNLQYNPRGYWEKGVNNHFSNQFDHTKTIPGASFLTMSLFHKSRGHLWNNQNDRVWRFTTRAPYFDNKQPGTKSIMPAAAVVGAATAFGVYSLLPLNVPSEKPIMSCNATELKQSKIMLHDNIYYCVNGTIKILSSHEKTTDTMICDQSWEAEQSVLFCTNGTLLSTKSIVCNATNDELDENSSILNCYFGSVIESIGATVPTEGPEYTEYTVVTEKKVSLNARVHMFLLWTIGKLHILDIKKQEFEHIFLTYVDTKAALDDVLRRNYKAS